MAFKLDNNNQKRLAVLILLLPAFFLSLIFLKTWVTGRTAAQQKLICPPTSGHNKNALQMVDCYASTEIPSKPFVPVILTKTPASKKSPKKGGTKVSKVPLYKQWDPRWGNISFGGCGSIASSGCGPTSLAMVISYWKGKQILPPQTAKQAIHVCGLGTAYSSLVSVPQMYGLRSKVISWAEAIRYLKQGIPVINVQGPGYFTMGGHYIVVTGINTNGTYAINDPDGFHRTQATEAQIVASRIMTWVITK